MTEQQGSRVVLIVGYRYPHSAPQRNSATHPPTVRFAPIADGTFENRPAPKRTFSSSQIWTLPSSAPYAAGEIVH
jgi:hypothetical protein